MLLHIPHQLQQVGETPLVVGGEMLLGRVVLAGWFTLAFLSFTPSR